MPNWNTVRNVARLALSRGMMSQLRLAVVSHAKAGEAECPLCGYSGTFYPFGMPLRTGVMCPQCWSLERHRLFGLALRSGQLDFTDKTIVHFAAEHALRRAILEQRPRGYRTSDFASTTADLRLDLENIALPDQSEDVIIASHILEHVDDGKALREIFRVLKPGGCLVAMIPIIEGWENTYEDPTKTTEAERERYFGQYDHVRWFGSDFRERVRAAGFTLDEITAGPIDALDYRLDRGEKIFVARKPS